MNWERDVSLPFQPLRLLETPHRWNRAGTPAIGSWLRVIRQRLEQGDPIDLTTNLPFGVTFVRVNAQIDLFRIQGNTCRYFRCDPSESVVAIHKRNNQYKAKCHVLAKNVGADSHLLRRLKVRPSFRSRTRFRLRRRAKSGSRRCCIRQSVHDGG